MSKSSSLSPSSSSSPPIPIYFYLQSPYLKKEMHESIEKQRKIIEKYFYSLILSSSSSSSPPSTSPSPHLTLLSRTDSQCLSFIDDITRRVVLSTSSFHSLKYFPIFIYWTDGANRAKPLRAMENIYTQFIKTFSSNHNNINRKSLLSYFPYPTPSSPPLVFIIGGSNSIRSSILDNKSLMRDLYIRHPRKWIPKTEKFDLRNNEKEWKEIIENFLSKGKEDVQGGISSQFVILKPSSGLKQKGILVVPKSIASLPTIINHITINNSITMDNIHIGNNNNNKYKYNQWVIQEYIKYPLMISGADIAILYGEEGRVKKWMEEGEGKGDTVGGSTARSISNKTSSTSISPSSSSSPSINSLLNRYVTESHLLPTGYRPHAKSSPSSDSKKSNVASSSAKKKTKSIISPSSQDDEDNEDEGDDNPSSSPALRSICLPHEIPSDTGSPVSLYGYYKIHFRVYCAVIYNGDKKEFEPFVCKLMKLYHSVKPLGTIEWERERNKGREKEKVWKEEDKENEQTSNHTKDKIFSHLFQNENKSTPSSPPSPFSPSSPLPPFFTSLRDDLDHSQSVSSYLCFRLAHHIFPEEFLYGKFFPQVKKIIFDSIQLAANPNGKNTMTEEEKSLSSLISSSSSLPLPFLPENLLPQPWSHHSFQLLGYDFLYDTSISSPILLEVNNNVGQGFMKRAVMTEKQQQGRERYDYMHWYWTMKFRRPFCEDLMERVMEGVRGGKGEGEENDNNNSVWDGEGMGKIKETKMTQETKETQNEMKELSSLSSDI